MPLRNKQTAKGFTLIELMIVIGIIGILAAIAIPQFNEYRMRSFNATAQSDLRNILTAEEGYYASNQQYVNLAPILGYQANLPSLAGARISLNVCAKVTSASSTDFTAQTQHKNGDETLTSSQSGSLSSTSKGVGVLNLGC